MREIKLTTSEYSNFSKCIAGEYTISEYTASEYTISIQLVSALIVHS